MNDCHTQNDHNNTQQKKTHITFSPLQLHFDSSCHLYLNAPFIFQIINTLQCIQTDQYSSFAPLVSPSSSSSSIQSAHQCVSSLTHFHLLSFFLPPVNLALLLQLHIHLIFLPQMLLTLFSLPIFCLFYYHSFFLLVPLCFTQIPETRSVTSSSR